MVAARGGYFEIARLLLREQADINKRSDGKKSALDYASTEEIKWLLVKAHKMNAIMTLESSLGVAKHKSSNLTMVACSFLTGTLNCIL